MTFPVLGIPNAGDVPAQSQALIQSNFNNIIGWSAVDHIQYGSTNAGQHAQITLPNTEADPSPLPSGVSSILYSKSVGGVAQLWFANSAGAQPITGAETPSGNGYTTLPGGFILQWTSAVCGSATSVTFPTPFLVACYSVVATSDNDNPTNGNVNVTNVTTSGFIGRSANVNNVRFMAIGK